MNSPAAPPTIVRRFYSKIRVNNTALGAGLPEFQRLNPSENENARLKRHAAVMALEHTTIREVLGRNPRAVCARGAGGDPAGRAQAFSYSLVTLHGWAAQCARFSQ